MLAWPNGALAQEMQASSEKVVTLSHVKVCSADA